MVEQCSFNPNGTAAAGSHHRAGTAETDASVISFDPICKHHAPWLDNTHAALRWLSISILIMFVFELLLLFVVLRSIFFSSIVYVVDIVVVTTSLILDIILFTMASRLHSEEAAQFATLLVAARLWRFIRVGANGAACAHTEHEPEERARNRVLCEPLFRRWTGLLYTLCPGCAARRGRRLTGAAAGHGLVTATFETVELTKV